MNMGEFKQRDDMLIYTVSSVGDIQKKKLFKAVYSISIVKPTRSTNVSNLFYFGMTLYIFRTVFPSIIRSSRLFIQLAS